MAAPPEGLEAWLACLLERRGLPGIAVAVTDRDRLLSFQSAGWADLGLRRPIDEGTLFELGSIGKTFTALLVLELAKGGVIDLEAPVPTYLPWFEVRSEYEPIAVRHLLTHSAGIIRGSDITADSRFDVWALRETETGFAPGERYYYSNVGFRVLGCALESDAHTVGIDAIFNPKGFAGDPGLERYRGFDARNLGAQVPTDRLVRLARESNADALLVSATVTQNEIHVRHLTDLVDMLEAERLRDRIVLVAGGARVDHALAKELGYDGGFGPGTTASRVAGFLLEEISRRRDRPGSSA